jgi:transposase
LESKALTPRAKQRVKIIDCHRRHGDNISLTARHFGLTRFTIRDWLKRIERYGIASLNEKSRRLRNFRKPATPLEYNNQDYPIEKTIPWLVKI